MSFLWAPRRMDGRPIESGAGEGRGATFGGEGGDVGGGARLGVPLIMFSLVHHGQTFAATDGLTDAHMPTLQGKVSRWPSRLRGLNDKGRAHIVIDTVAEFFFVVVPLLRVMQQHSTLLYARGAVRCFCFLRVWQPQPRRRTDNNKKVRFFVCLFGLCWSGVASSRRSCGLANQVVPRLDFFGE